MKTVLESSIFKNNTLVKTYSQDFEYPDFEESLEELNFNGVVGTSKEIHMNGIHLEIRDVDTPKNYSIEVAHDFPLFKLHFEIEGDNRYTPANNNGVGVYIPSGHYNLFYLPEVVGTLSYATSHRKTLEIKFTEAYIKKIIGSNFKESLVKLGEAIATKTPFLMWKKSKPISAELQHLINEICVCRYTGMIKNAYLEAKVTELLIVLLAKTDSNAEIHSLADLPEEDYDKILKVETYIQHNLSQAKTIAELALLAGMNTSKLKTDFKKVFGTTIFKYITDLRMKKAVKLILEDKYTIARASAEVGYKNPQHFTVAYKKKYGCLPKALISE